MKFQNVTKNEWNHLIVLDACRYDFFQKYYETYLDGELEKRKSRGSNTAEWLEKTFKRYYEDITYFSANPFINGRGLSLNDVYSDYNSQWKAIEHFAKIIDVWDFGWDEDLGTVPPEEVNKAFFSHNYKNRKIIHYMQPHKPYLAFKKASELNIRKWIKNGKGSNDNTFLESFKRSIGKKLQKSIKKGDYWKLKHFVRKLRIFGVSSATGDEKAWLQGNRYLYYKDNLKRVLKAVSRLIDKLQGQIIVTSDHGEAFGEHGFWLHSPNVYIPELIYVPWLTIEK